jgi:hypothetical protein
MSDYVSELRRDLVEAAARQQKQSPAARATRSLHPRAWSPTAAFGLAAALAAVVVLVVGLRTVSPPRPPETPKIVDTFRIDGQPHDAVNAGGAVLVADFTAGLVRVGRGGETQLVLPPKSSLSSSIVADGATVWGVRVNDERSRPCCELVRVTRDGRALARLPVSGTSGPLAVGAGGVWLATPIRTGQNRRVEGIERIDPRTGKVSVVVPGVEVDDIAASERFVWTRHGETVTQWNERGRVVARVTGISPMLGLRGQRTIAADRDGAWVVGQSDGLLYRIEGGQVVKRIRLGHLGGAIARTKSAVWVTALTGADRFELLRVDPDDGIVTGRVAVGSVEPQMIVPIGKEVWLITDRGDVLRVSQG